ncbi:MAG: hypothetical protein HPY45_05935 [Anaerolineae bacterium]|nr:hypothetical protein [Anaerolineae bacterium]
MARRIFFFVMVLCVLLAACGPSVDAPATQTAVFATALMQVQTEMAQVTNTPAIQPTPESASPLPVETTVPDDVEGSLHTPQPTIAAPPPSGPVIFEDAFDVISEDWKTVWVTTYTENLSKSTVGADQGWLFFDLKDKATMLYSFYTPLVEKDVVIETVNDMDGSGQTEVSVACRASSDYTSWMDFRIFYFYEYAIYAYDRSSASTGQNPYTELVRAPFSRDLLFPGENNLIRATCKQNTFALELNGTQLGSVQSDKNISPGFVGVGGISPMDSGAAVWFDYVRVTRP